MTDPINIEELRSRFQKSKLCGTPSFDRGRAESFLVSSLLGPTFTTRRI